MLPCFVFLCYPVHLSYDIQNGTIVATGSVNVSSTYGILTNTVVRLNKTVTASDIDADAMFIGFILWDGATGMAQAGRNIGVTANSHTNNQSHYALQPNNSWQDYAGDPDFGFVQNMVTDTGKSILVIGDSVFAGSSNNKPMSTRLEELATADSDMSLSFIGTKSNLNSTVTSPDEARAGWARYTFYSTVASPFVKPSGGTFDFEYYCTNNAFAAPDYIVDCLGLNSLLDNDITDDVAAWDAEVSRIDAMHSSVTSYSPSTKYFLCELFPPAYTQDAAGKNYDSDTNRDKQKLAQVRWASWMHDEYAGRESEGIYLIPLTAVLDTRNNFPTETVAISERNTNIIVRQSNLVHPADAGAWQLADQIFSKLKLETR